MTVSGPLVCSRCGRVCPADDSGLGWSLARAPRPTGAAVSDAQPGPVTALCPECLRRSVRDLEARLDP